MIPRTNILARPTLLIVLFGLIYALITAFVENSYYQLIMAVVPIWAVMGLSWNVLSGYSGYVSFGHAAFFGLGAYFVALAQIKFGVTPWLSIPLAGVLGGVAGLLVGIPTFRLRGHYFALAMLAYPLAFLYLFEWLGYQELAMPMMRDEPLKYMQFADTRIYAYLALALMLGAMLLSSAIERSRFGLSLMAIKQDEAAAEAAADLPLAGFSKRVYPPAPLIATSNAAAAAGHESPPSVRAQATGAALILHLWLSTDARAGAIEGRMRRIARHVAGADERGEAR